MNKRKWPMPKNAHYSRYCCHCHWWTYERSAGVANIGTCNPYPDLGGKQWKADAYDPPCGLFKEKGSK